MILTVIPKKILMMKKRRMTKTKHSRLQTAQAVRQAGKLTVQLIRNIKNTSAV